MSENLLPIVRIIHTPKIGPSKFWQLWEKFHDLEKIIQWLSDNQHTLPTQEWAEQHIKNHEKKGIHLSHFLHPSFPKLLHHIISCPPLLYMKGKIDLLDKPMVGIVGARGASVPMAYFTKKLAADLGQAGFVVVSGLASGIDTAAHLGSLSTGTIGVCAGGIDQIYPQQNQKLYQDVGLLISEMSLGTKPTSYLFPRRNRIIAGLSQGVVVIEASFQSGSLITGQYAMEFNRDVFVVPGSPLDPRSKGGNKLLKDGAYLAENASDILRVLGIKTEKAKTEVVSPQTSCDSRPDSLLCHLSHIPISVDVLHQHTQQPLDVIHKELSRLELEGLITKDPNGFVALFTS